MKRKPKVVGVVFKNRLEQEEVNPNLPIPEMMLKCFGRSNFITGYEDYCHLVGRYNWLKFAEDFNLDVYIVMGAITFKRNVEGSPTLTNGELVEMVKTFKPCEVA